MRVSNQAPSRLLPVLGVSGEHLFLCDEIQARDLIRSRKCRLVWRGGRVRSLQATVDMNRRGDLRQAGRGTAFDHTRYSHRHETVDNPPNCWTLTHLASGTEALFMRVLIDCLCQ